MSRTTRPTQTGHDGHTDGTVVLWQQADGWWRWRWTPEVDPADGAGAAESPGPVSNEAYPQVPQARSSARTAYPGARLVDPTQDAAGRPGVPAPVRRPAGRLALLVVGLAVGVVVLIRHRGAWPRRDRVRP